MTTKVTFKIPASQVAAATEAILLGEFNNWDPAEAVVLQRSDDGSMQAEIELTAGKTYKYRYLLNDGRWVNDERPTSWDMAYDNFVENAVIEVPVATNGKAENKLQPKVAATAKPAAEKAVKQPAIKKAATTKKAKPEAEDLLKIKGIGTRIFYLLKRNDILTYKTLANTSTKKLEQLLKEAGAQYSSYNPENWPKQAKLAAAGKWDELETLQSAMK